MFFALGIARNFASHPAFCAATDSDIEIAAATASASIFFISRNLLFRFPDVANPRHRLAEAVGELICLEVLNAAEHDDLSIDTVLLQFCNPLLGGTNGLNLIVSRV